MKTPEKLYFKSTEDTNCYSLPYILHNARLDGLDEITLIEAIPDNDNPDYIFCGYVDEVGERSECRKSFCFEYSSKSGRGVCEHRGKLYTYGKEIEFDVPK